jgi:hypothetical protein
MVINFPYLEYIRDFDDFEDNIKLDITIDNNDYFYDTITYDQKINRKSDN